MSKLYCLKNESPLSLVFVETKVSNIFDVDIAYSGDYKAPAGVQLINYDYPASIIVYRDGQEKMIDEPVNCWVVTEKQLSIKARQFFTVMTDNIINNIEHSNDIFTIVGVFDIFINNLSLFMARPHVTMNVARVIRAFMALERVN